MYIPLVQIDLTTENDRFYIFYFSSSLLFHTFRMCVLVCNWTFRLDYTEKFWLHIWFISLEIDWHDRIYMTCAISDTYKSPCTYRWHWRAWKKLMLPVCAVTGSGRREWRFRMTLRIEWLFIWMRPCTQKNMLKSWMSYSHWKTNRSSIKQKFNIILKFSFDLDIVMFNSLFKKINRNPNI